MAIDEARDILVQALRESEEELPERDVAQLLLLRAAQAIVAVLREIEQ